MWHYFTCNVYSSLFDLQFGHYNCFFDAKEKSSRRTVKRPGSKETRRQRKTIITSKRQNSSRNRTKAHDFRSIHAALSSVTTQPTTNNGYGSCRRRTGKTTQRICRRSETGQEKTPRGTKKAAETTLGMHDTGQTPQQNEAAEPTTQTHITHKI